MLEIDAPFWLLFSVTLETELPQHFSSRRDRIRFGRGSQKYQGSKSSTVLSCVPVPGLQVRDGLSAINGSNVITGMSCLLLYDAERWVKQAEKRGKELEKAADQRRKAFEKRADKLRKEIERLDALLVEGNIASEGSLIVPRLRHWIADEHLFAKRLLAAAARWRRSRPRAPRGGRAVRRR